MRIVLTSASDRDILHEYASPLLRESLEGVPPATIINAQHDPLCDHGTLYAAKLRAHNIPVMHSIYGGALHGFFGLRMLSESEEAMVEAAMGLRFGFGLEEENFELAPESPLRGSGGSAV